MEKAPVSVVIITYNEEGLIEGCLQSVYGWADEIIVVDDESTDKTKEICEKYADKVFTKKMVNQGVHRNWADSQARNDWVLSLDADERVTDELKVEIKKTLAQETEYSGFNIPRKNHMGNYWMRWGGQYPSRQLKLFKKDKFRWEEVEVHPRVFLEGKSKDLNGDIIHYTYKNYTDLLNKTNRQTTLEAKKWYKLSFKEPKRVEWKMNFPHAVWRTLDRFFRYYLKKKGFLDGFVGFMAAYMAGFYQIVSYAKFRELKKSSRAD